jgi:hypothetical protein
MTMNPEPPASPPAPYERNSNQNLRTPTDQNCEFDPPHSGTSRNIQPTPKTNQIPKT